MDCFYVTGHESDDPKKYYNTTIELSNIEYAKQILEFAKQAFGFLPKFREGDKWEVAIYHAWRDELEALIKMTKDYLKDKEISSEMRNRAGKFDLSTGGVI